MESQRFHCHVDYSKFCVYDDDLSCTSKSPTSDIYNLSSVASIRHPVSKLDTLAGVAIRYGVEVADIKKMNGLVTDLQMFAHKSIQIPQPGRHPPSPALSNGSHTPRKDYSDATVSFRSFKQYPSKLNISPAMSSLQGYYGLDSVSSSLSTDSIKSPGRHRKSRSLVDCFMDEKLMLAESSDDSDKRVEKLIRRRQKSEADFSKSYANIPIWDDTAAASDSAITRRNLALRCKAPNQTETEFSSAPISILDSLERGGCSSVRKSSSTSNLHDQDNSSASSWSTSMWNLKPDLQALSQTAIARPIFDGLPKPIPSRRNKAALD